MNPIDPAEAVTVKARVVACSAGHSFSVRQCVRQFVEVLGCTDISAIAVPASEFALGDDWMDERFYLGLANELVAKLRRVSSFTSHGPSVGTYHEEALRTILRTMLPERFSLRNGFVFHPTRGASQQGDILVVDEHYPGAYFFREGDFAVVAEEALVCVIEVKTRLNKRSFCEALGALHSFRKIATATHVPTFLFAYESASFTDATLNAWYKAAEIPDLLPNYPWAIYVLHQGLLLLRKQTFDGGSGHVVTFDNERPRARPKVKELSVFLATFRKVLLMRGGAVANPFELASLDGVHWSDAYLKFGSGWHAPESGVGLADTSSTPAATC